MTSKIEIQMMSYVLILITSPTKSGVNLNYKKDSEPMMCLVVCLCNSFLRTYRKVLQLEFNKPRRTSRFAILRRRETGRY